MLWKVPDQVIAVKAELTGVALVIDGACNRVSEWHIAGVGGEPAMIDSAACLTTCVGIANGRYAKELEHSVGVVEAQRTVRWIEDLDSRLHVLLTTRPS